MRSGPPKASAIIVVDLDGPILDTRRRHHACYARILRDAGCRPLDLQAYWRLKRRQAGPVEVLAIKRCRSISAADFERQWLRLIEQPSVLALDRLQEGVVSRLGRWKKEGFYLVLASMRRNRRNARAQVRRLGLSELFQAVTFSRPTAGPEGKAASVVAVMPRDRLPGLWIGDTEADVVAARIAGFRSVAVSCGIRSRAQLLSLEPDVVVPRVAAIRRDQLSLAAAVTRAPTR